MKKSDLKDWMVVERRNGQRYIVHLDSQRLLYDGGWNNLQRYNEDLTHCWETAYDIIKVFKTEDPLSSNLNELKDHLLWQREEKSEAQLEIESIRKTQEELAQRLKELEKKV